MSNLDKITKVYDPATGKWTTKEQYRRARDGYLWQIPCTPIEVPWELQDEMSLLANPLLYRRQFEGQFVDDKSMGFEFNQGYNKVATERLRLGIVRDGDK